MDFENIDLKWENMRAGIIAQVPYLRESPASVYAGLKETLQLDKPPSRVYLTGCGDSWYCGMATQYAFEAWAGLPTQAPQALDFSRYGVKTAPTDSLLITVSNSGRVARTIEAAVQARKHGLYTVGCTGNLESGLSQEVDAVVDLAYAERRFAPGTSSYMASLVAQYCLALYLAELNGSMTSAAVQEKLAEMSTLADGMQRMLDEGEAVLDELAGRASLDEHFVFIGGGPNYGTAFFSMAKVIEATQATGVVGQELEEWAHIQFFVTNSGTYTFILAPPGGSAERARELVEAVNAMGSTSVIVCDADDRNTQAGADVVVPVFGGTDEILSPLLYCVPGELFALHLAMSKSSKMFIFDDESVKEMNFRQVFGSAVLRD